MWRALLVAATIGLAEPAPMRIVVNLPAYRLEVFAGDSLVRTLPIAVGMPRFPTPRGEFEITSIEWNPWWIPPDRPWAAKERPTPPGPKNPMGRVKLNFKPLYFLHGSPFAGSIGSAASHGCIRLKNEDAVALARLVHTAGTPDLAASGGLDRLATDTATRLVALDAPVPLEIRYDLVELRRDSLYVYRDIYRLGARPLNDEIGAALIARDPAAVADSARVAAFVSRARTRGGAVPIDSLLRPRRRDQ